MNKLLYPICYLIGHKWDQVHGYRNEAEFDAVCQRCGLKNESYEDWAIRNP